MHAVKDGSLGDIGLAASCYAGGGGGGGERLRQSQRGAWLTLDVVFDAHSAGTVSQ